MKISSSILLLLLLTPALIEGCGGKKKGRGKWGKWGKKKGRCRRGIGIIGQVIGNVVPIAQEVAQQAGSYSMNYLPAFLSQEPYDAYIRRIFRRNDETEDEYFARIFKQYENESNEKYVTRVDTIFSQFPTLSCRHNPEYWSVAQNYYRLKYGRIEDIFPSQHETEEEYFTRILKKEQNEDFNAFIKRMDCVFLAYPKLAIWRKVQFSNDWDNWYVTKEIEYCSYIKPSLNIRENIIQTYGRRNSEVNDDLTYFKRICKRRVGECDNEYVLRLTTIKEKFGNLPLWYSKEYLSLIKEYYTLFYHRKDKEDWNDYYKRITFKSDSEALEIYIKRMSILELVFNQLPLWQNENFLQFTGTYYIGIYAKFSTEDDAQYLQRITTRSRSEDVDKYVRRINIVRWVCRRTDFFSNTKYLTYTKTYLENYFKKGSETVDGWLDRIFKRCYLESDDEYVKRCSMLRLFQDNLLSLDLADEYIKYASDYFKLFYKRLPGEEMVAWRKRITARDESETDVIYQIRLRCIGNVFPECKKRVQRILKKKFGFILGTSKTVSGESPRPEIKTVEKVPVVKGDISIGG